MHSSKPVVAQPIQNRCIRLPPLISNTPKFSFFPKTPSSQIKSNSSTSPAKARHFQALNLKFSVSLNEIKPAKPRYNDFYLISPRKHGNPPRMPRRSEAETGGGRGANRPLARLQPVKRQIPNNHGHFREISAPFTGLLPYTNKMCGRVGRHPFLSLHALTSLPHTPLGSVSTFQQFNISTPTQTLTALL